MDRSAVAAATLLASFDGPEAPRWLLDRIDRGLGGVCLFASNLTGSVEEVTGALHHVRPGVVVATDEEGGDVTRVWAAGGSPVPGNAALGGANDPAMTRVVADALGAHLAASGVDLNLAPVADVNLDPGNPAIGVRSFGSEPALVATHVAAFVEGLQARGVAACVKHFPGHGATTVDSHLALPVIDATPEVLAARELVPFRAAIAAGVAAVMSGHLLVPALDDRPATTSRRLLVDLLRHELGFEGAVVTDALDMGGITGAARIPETVVAALAAGADLCCLGPGATDELAGACVDAVVGAVERDELDEARLMEASERVAHLAGQGEPRPAPTVDIEAVGLDAARRAVRVEGDAVLTRPAARVVEIGPAPMVAAGDIPWGLTQALAGLGLTIDAADSELVVAYRDTHRDPTSERRLRSLVAGRPDAVLVDMGWPHPDPPRARGRIITFGAAPPCARAAAEILAGRLAPASASNAGDLHG